MKINITQLTNKYLILKNLKGNYVSVFVVKNRFKLEQEIRETVFNYFGDEDYKVIYNDTHILFSKEEDFLYIFNANQAIINV